jgi:predicted molibdopterin-dependent oxidoreductase YjgC
LVRKGLEALTHLIVIDIFITETAELADVVLPATAWGETDGSYTNTERRVQRIRAAVPPQGGARPDWWIVAELAKRLGFEGFEWTGPEDVFDEYCELSPIYYGLSWKRISEGPGLQWPVPHKGHPGTFRLHEKEFPNGRGIFKTITYRDPAEVISEDYPVWLTTGRRLESYHTRTQTGRAEGIDYLLSEEVLEVHPADVEDWGLSDGGFALMSSPRGSVKIKVQANDRSPRGTVFSSFSFSDTPVNILTGGGYDPVTQTAELKVCPVRLEPA